MKLRFTARATGDLAEIADYIRKESPRGAVRVRASILESLQLLADFPEIGRLQTIEGVRKHVARKYGYLIYIRSMPEQARSRFSRFNIRRENVRSPIVEDRRPNK